MNIPKFGSKEEENDFHKTRIESLDLELPATLSDIFLSKSIRTIGGVVKRSNKELKREFNISKNEIMIIEQKIKTFCSKQKSLNKTIALNKAISLEDEQVAENQKLKPVRLNIASEDNLIAFFATHLGVSKDEIEGSYRNRKIVRARNLTVYILREYGGMSFSAIGKLLGGRNHTTAIYAYRKIKGYFEKNKILETDLIKLINKAKDLREDKNNIENVILDFNTPNLYKTENVLRFKEIPERETKVLELYREGITLENISKTIRVTRERIRQIIKKTLKQISINESISNSSVIMDSDVLFKKEKQKRENLKLQTKLIKQKIYKEKSWSRHHTACKSCGTVSTPHFINGLCENCGNKTISGGMRENIITEHKNKCDCCDMSREEARIKYGRDFYLSRKNKSVFCKKCYLFTTGNKLGNFRKNKWRMFYK